MSYDIIWADFLKLLKTSTGIHWSKHFLIHCTVTRAVELWFSWFHQRVLMPPSGGDHDLGGFLDIHMTDNKGTEQLNVTYY